MPNYLPNESDFSSERLLNEIETRDDVYIPFIIDVKYIRDVIWRFLDYKFSISEEDAKIILKTMKDNQFSGDDKYIIDYIIDAYKETL